MNQKAFSTTVGVLKPLHEVNLPDPRFETEILEDENGLRPIDIRDIHDRLILSQIAPNAPEQVRTQFNVARNLMLYAWFIFEFQTVAEMQAYSTLELALRIRFQYPTKTIITKKGTKEIPLMLADLLTKALNSGLIVPDRLPMWKHVQDTRKLWAEIQGLQPGPMSASEWFKKAVDVIPNERNSMAHGNQGLWFTKSLAQLELCADIINSLFP